MGFSIIGSVIALAILAPSLAFLVAPPADGPLPVADTAPLFRGLERVGQIACLVVTGASQSSFEGRSPDVATALVVVCVLVYYGLWGRYLATGRRVASLYAPLGPLPVPMAIFPVLAFAFTAMWARSIWIGVASVVLAAGHVTNSWHIAVMLRDRSSTDRLAP